MKLTFKYPVYPTQTQETTLLQWLEHLCELQNSARHDRKVAWETEGQSISCNEQQKKLTVAREKYADFREVPQDMQVCALERTDKAFDGFYRRCKKGASKKGYPRHRKRIKSMTWKLRKHSVKNKSTGEYERVRQSPIRETFWKHDRLKVPKLGEVKIYMHRRLQGDPTQVALVKIFKILIRMVIIMAINAQRFPLLIIGLLFCVLGCTRERVDMSMLDDHSAPMETHESVDVAAAFAQNILPILTTRCALSGCHVADGPHGLDFRTYESFKAGGEHGPAFIPGNAEGSAIVEEIVSGRMPPGGPPLTDAEIQLFRDWINQQETSDHAVQHEHDDEEDADDDHAEEDMDGDHDEEDDDHGHAGDENEDNDHDDDDHDEDDDN